MQRGLIINNTINFRLVVIYQVESYVSIQLQIVLEGYHQFSASF